MSPFFWQGGANMELREQVFELIKNTKKNEPVNLRKFKGMGPKSISMVEKILNQ